MKLTRKEMDELGAVAIKAIKTIDPQLTSKHLQKILGRLYSKLLKSNKLEQEELKAQESKPDNIFKRTKKVS